MKKLFVFVWVVVGLFVLPTQAVERYVDLNNPAPVAPYTNWATAATNIQNAVDAAVAGDVIWVTNGVYNSGSKVTPGYACLNRVVITNNIRVQTVNGPQTTLIVGAEASGGGNGTDAVRGVYMSAGLLSGFTVTNGHTQATGDEWYDRSGGGINQNGGSGIVSNCVLTGNSAASSGGGNLNGTLNNCTLTGNSAVSSGGGSDCGTLNNCTLFGNSAHSGGGSFYAKLNNCTLTGNSARYGGGSYYGTLNNCIVYFNSAAILGKNWRNSTLAYCCTEPLPAGAGNITNAPMLVSASHLHTDSPCVGAGNTTYSAGVDIDGEAWLFPPSMGSDEPSAPMTGALTVSVSANYVRIAQGYNLHFSAGIAGEVASNRWTFGDGTVLTNAIYEVQHAWASTGTYEIVLIAWNEDYPAGISATAQVEVVTANFYVNAGNSSPAVPYTSWATAATNIQDAVDHAIYIVGSTVWVADGFYNSGSRVTPGYACLNRVVITNDIRVQSVNGPQNTLIVGAAASGGGNGSNAVRGVYMSAGLLTGFTITNGHTSTTGDKWYDCSGGGSYGDGGIVSNCVLTSNSASFAGGGSVNGTLNNCILTGNSSSNYGGGSCYGTLNSCTLTGNSASYGGGNCDGTLNNCTLTGNSASLVGGGSYFGTLYNCTLTGNSASESGGGSFYATLNNCTLTGNSASESGGGSYDGKLNNCIVYLNSASVSDDNWIDSTFAYSCTAPLPAGAGNISNNPLFIDSTNANYRLSSASPCINAGHNNYCSTTTDLDGNPRVIGGVVDMGAYERQDAGTDVDSDNLADAWEMSYFGSRYSAQPNAICSNGVNTIIDAYIAGFNPADPAAFFGVESAEPSQNGFVVSWHSVTGRVYDVFRTPCLDQGFESLAAGLSYPVNSYTDTVHSVSSNGFYKISVRLPEP